LPSCQNCGHEVSNGDEFCQNCGTPRKETTKPESRISVARTVIGALGRLKSLRALLLIAIIVGGSMVAASFALQPRSTSPDYLADLKDQLNQTNGQLLGLQQQADNLRGQVSALQREISAAQGKVSTLQKEIEQLQNQLASVKSEIASLRQQLGDVQSQLTSARSSLDAAQKQLDQIRSSLQEATAKVQQLESALQQQKVTLQNYVSNRDQAQSTHDSLLAEYNSRASTYNDRMNTYNQKKQEYDTRWSNLKGKILGTAVIGAVAIAIASFLTEGLALSDIPAVLSILSTFGIDVQGMWTEYQALQQLKAWLQNEEDWLQSESRQLESLKSRLDKATSDLAYWNGKVQSQQGIVAETQNDLDYWTTQKNQLTGQLNDAQNRVDQLATQVRDLESQQASLQSSLNSGLGKEQQLESSIESDQSEVKGQQELISSRSSQKSAAETTLGKCEADIGKAKNQVDMLSYEINLVVVHPYLRWGGLGIFALGVAVLIVTTVGVATLASGMRAGIDRIRRPRRTGPIPESGVPIETTEPAAKTPVARVEEAPAEAAEIPAKPALEIAAVQGSSTVSKTTKPRRRRRPSGRRTTKREKVRPKRSREKETPHS
jgi:predicted  nucleic acid-binding Zn-ribbon protein